MPQGVFRPKKVFSLQEANQTLPLVSRIVKDIVLVETKMREAHAEERRLAGEGRSVLAKEAQDRLHDLADQVAEYAEELERIGGLLKDPALGLVDFPARIGGRIVFLCWKLGEEEIRFWHEIEAGFRGRKPVQGIFA